jgi:S-disulfanyl-L-cysteine oxidoreductase SoxD
MTKMTDKPLNRPNGRIARMLWCAVSLSLAVALGVYAQNKQDPLGRPATTQEIKQQDITVLPDGRGLPDGKGTPAEGEKVYAQNCAACHGANGEGTKEAPALVGGVGTLASSNPIRTVGSYWPYATTVWDYIHRAMPQNSPGSLSVDENYAVVAFLLNRNNIIPHDAVMNKETLPKVRMPNRDGFIPDARPDTKNTATTSK